MAERSKAGAAAAGEMTMGGKPKEHWDGVFEQLKKTVVRLDRVRRGLEENGDEDGATRAYQDIMAIIEVIVVADFEYFRHFGEKSVALTFENGPVS